MPTRIAHLSDLHYGRTFDTALWQSVERAVAAFDPHLLIVSGDMVDDPREDHLRVAKQTLDNLAASLGAGLYVVAGNHDLFFSGLDLTGGRSAWFNHIFNDSNAADERVRIATAPTPAAPGFTRLEGGLWQTLKDRARVFLGVGAHGVRPPEPPHPPAASPLLCCGNPNRPAFCWP
jgi:predicted MPP superfamily phosphohydrolase